MSLRTTAVVIAVLVLAACTSIPTPTGTPAVTPTGTPPPTATAQPTLSPTPTPTLEPSLPPTAPPTALPTASPTPSRTPIATWTGPDLIVTGVFEEADIAVDATGAAHIAAAGYGVNNRGIWYITDATGTWTTERVSVPPGEGGHEDLGYDGEPSIAVDPSNGSVWVAFTRWGCWGCAHNPSDGIFVVTNASGSWRQLSQLAGAQAGQPSLIARDGLPYVAYAEGTVRGQRSSALWYRTYWSLERVARNGSSPQLFLDQQGNAQILFKAADIRLASEPPDGPFGVVSLPGSADGMTPRYWFDPESWTGSACAAWSAYSDDELHINTMYTSPVSGAWTEPITAIPDGDVTGMGAQDGVVHLIANLADAANWGALLYATNASGRFVVTTLYGSGGRTSALVVDAAGRPHITFTLDDPASKRGVWYAVGPGV